MIARTSSTLKPRESKEFSDREIEVTCVPNCPICGTAEYRTYAIGFDYELRTCRNRWRFVRCSECAHLWLNPRPALSALPVIYPKSYYAYNYDQQIHWLARRGKEWLDSRKMSSILAYLRRQPRSYLDVGCGNGRFLKLMNTRVHLPPNSIYGLDIDEANICRLAADGYQVFCERIEDFTRMSAGSIDLVTMFHVLEHLDDPVPVIRRIGDWLSPGGVVAIETPNIDSWDARLFRKGYWGGYHFPRHWNLFTPSTMRRLFTQGGLEYVATIFLTGHSFWAYSFHHWLRYGAPGWTRLAQRFDPFATLLPVILFTGFDQLRAACGFRTSSMLMLGRKVPA